MLLLSASRPTPTASCNHPDRGWCRHRQFTGTRGAAAHSVSPCWSPKLLSLELDFSWRSHPPPAHCRSRFGTVEQRCAQAIGSACLLEAQTTSNRLRHLGIQPAQRRRRQRRVPDRPTVSRTQNLAIPSARGTAFGAVKAWVVDVRCDSLCCVLVSRSVLLGRHQQGGKGSTAEHAQNRADAHDEACG